MKVSQHAPVRRRAGTTARPARHRAERPRRCGSARPSGIVRPRLPDRRAFASLPGTSLAGCDRSRVALKPSRPPRPLTVATLALSRPNAYRSWERLNSRAQQIQQQWSARGVRDQAGATEMLAQVWGFAPELALTRLVRRPAAKLARELQVSGPTKPRASHGSNLTPSNPTPKRGGAAMSEPMPSMRPIF